MPQDIKTRNVDKTSLKSLDRRDTYAEGIRDAIGEISIRTSDSVMRSFSAGDDDQIENEAVSGVANEARQSFDSFRDRVLGNKKNANHTTGVGRDYAYTGGKNAQNTQQKSAQRSVKARSSYQENSNYVRVRGAGLQSDELMRAAAQKDAVQRAVNSVGSTVSNRMSDAGSDLVTAAVLFGKKARQYGVALFWIFAVLYVVVFLVIVSDIFAVPAMWMQRLSSDALRQEIALVEADYSARIEELKLQNPDHVIEGHLADWSQVTAVYLARLNQIGEDNGIDNMDEVHRGIFEGIFWQMNVIETSEEIVEGKTILHIRTVNKTVEEMADILEFDDSLRSSLKQMLNPDLTQAWNQLLLGYGHGSGAMIEVARSQVGIREISENQVVFNDWYYGRTVNGNYPWCAAFVSWCADQCGLIDSGNMIKAASCSTIVKWLRENRQWHRSQDIVPEPGMLIFIDWKCDGDADHIGIVDYVDGDRVHTIEGNSSDMVKECSYSLTDSRIFGYGSISYD